jgi:NAD(P)-dependent dehydrogenase (short-subunit alcohol dehydrogenase family)
LLTTLSPGYQIPTGSQQPPGLQSKLDPQPAAQHVPTEDGGYQLYKAAGKLKGKKALITGGDSGIGQATAILFAMEGADSFITYLPEEEEDAQQTKSYVEGYGQTCHLMVANLKSKETCREVVDEALKQMGHINILFNNHAYQMMVHDIRDLTEEQWEHTFDTNIHRKGHTQSAVLCEANVNF